MSSGPSVSIKQKNSQRTYQTFVAHLTQCLGLSHKAYLSARRSRESHKDAYEATKAAFSRYNLVSELFSGESTENPVPHLLYKGDDADARITSPKLEAAWRAALKLANEWLDDEYTPFPGTDHLSTEQKTDISLMRDRLQRFCDAYDESRRIGNSRLGENDQAIAIQVLFDAVAVAESAEGAGKEDIEDPAVNAKTSADSQDDAQQALIWFNEQWRHIKKGSVKGTKLSQIESALTILRTASLQESAGKGKSTQPMPVTDDQQEAQTKIDRLTRIISHCEVMRTKLKERSNVSLTFNQGGRTHQLNPRQMPITPYKDQLLRTIDQQVERDIVRFKEIEESYDHASDQVIEDEYKDTLADHTEWERSVDRGKDWGARFGNQLDNPNAILSGAEFDGTVSFDDAYDPPVNMFDWHRRSVSTLLKILDEHRKILDAGVKMEGLTAAELKNLTDKLTRLDEIATDMSGGLTPTQAAPKRANEGDGGDSSSSKKSKAEHDD